jgi:broad specificity phosphatase PhoE
MNLVYLVRHGEPASGWGDASAEADPGLSSQGLVQAEAAAETLMAVSGAVRPQRAITSPMRRCRETAAAFSKRSGLVATVDARVAEVPTPPGIAPEARASWLRSAMAGTWAQVEGIDAAAWREEVAEAIRSMQGAVVFTHFLAINAAVSCAMGSDRVLAFRPAPASITTLRIADGALELVSLGRDLEGRVL